MAVFQKRHYQLFADMVAMLDEHLKVSVQIKLEVLFAADNPRFDRETFRSWIERRQRGEPLTGLNPNYKYTLIGRP